MKLGWNEVPSPRNACIVVLSEVHSSGENGLPVETGARGRGNLNPLGFSALLSVADRYHLLSFDAIQGRAHEQRQMAHA